MQTNSALAVRCLKSLRSTAHRVMYGLHAGLGFGTGSHSKQRQALMPVFAHSANRDASRSEGARRAGHLKRVRKSQCR